MDLGKIATDGWKSGLAGACDGSVCGCFCWVTGNGEAVRERVCECEREDAGEAVVGA